ncbi:hypothetical protein BKA70DRAFT_1563364 [Coprinopsis sp. MPI-PUGE-AT-0042]|nr:hypothetical protein BKA70DRAFT_1563364 [Coprinopsis sp. MPI-PUGE-AT-0042]
MAPIAAEGATSNSFDTSSASLRAPPTLIFTLASSPENQSKFGPRTGRLALSRPERQGRSIEIETPGLLTGTSRGVIPHLAWDVYAQHARDDNGVLKWVNIPWETFMEQNPPVPTLYAKHLAATSTSAPSNEAQSRAEDAERPLHSFLGFKPSNHILSMSPRDPNDTREMPPNQNDVLNVATLRGVRKLTPSEYTSHTHTLHPDIIFAPHDTPFTQPPYSQKRLTKSIDRTQGWIARLFNPQRNVVESVGKKGRKVVLKNSTDTVPPPAEPSAISTPATKAESHPRHPPIIAPLLGSTSLPAREHYASSLLEPLYGPDLATIEPYKCVDEGVSGYFVELASVRRDVFENGESNRVLDVGRGEGGQPNMPSHAASTSSSIVSAPSAASTSPDGQLPYTPLLHASLSPLPSSKPRIAFGITSPHEILRLVKEVGVDVVDAEWAVRLGSIGVGLDFAFPVPEQIQRDSEPGKGKDVGHNLYSILYTHDFTPVADALTSSLSPVEGKNVCPCMSCSPRSYDGDAELIRHGVDSDAWISGEATVASTTASGGTPTSDPTKTAKPPTYNPPHTRAYIHHLLHTHEMSAHALLVSHNLAVVEAFLRGIRTTLVNAPGDFEKEVQRFLETYAEPSELVERAAKEWKSVDVARGKGRLGREKEKDLGETGEVE